MTDTAGNRKRGNRGERLKVRVRWRRETNLNWSWFLETSLGDLIQDVSYGTQYNKIVMYTIQ